MASKARVIRTSEDIELNTNIYVPPPTAFATGCSFSVMSRISINTTVAMDNARRINSKKKTEIKASLAVLVNHMLRVARIQAATDTLNLKTCFSLSNKRILINVFNDFIWCY